MTLVPYDADALDQTAMRLFDMACTLRGMAQRSREEEGVDFAINDRKALEWLAKLRAWTEDAQQRFELAVIRNRGRRAADQVAAKTRK
jgi:hypothetical protein